jgi:Asp-tRNA(Asn)/Glu-tRNA(Gln) amidotransferase A subunit family amidase
MILLKVQPLRFQLLALAAALTGCVTERKNPPVATPDRAYVEYWPAPQGSNKLRVAVKDLIDVKGHVTSAGSEFLATTSKPAERDAACLAGFRAAGVHFVGKTNTSEFAVAPSGLNEFYGTPLNPIGNGKLIPGGSSCGSAVAVAKHTADIALGTDTAGSIRTPSACCGIAGLKTTHGLIPLEGVYPISPLRLDTVGPMARDVNGLVKGMDLLQPGFAGRYHSAAAAKPGAARIRVGRLYLDKTRKSIDEAIDAALSKAGFEVVKLDAKFLEQWKQATADADTIAASEAWLYDQKFRKEPKVKIRTKAVVALGEFQYHNSFPEARGRIAQWKAAVAAQLQHVDVIALPTLKNVPPKLPRLGSTPVFELRITSLQNTSAVNLAGNPAVAIPVPLHDRNVPVTSLELIGRPRGEAALLNVARLAEAAQR